jgi:hypothetical protein
MLKVIDYLLLHNVLCHSDWSCVLNENSVDSAVNNLTAIVREDLNVTYNPKILPFHSGFLML